MAIPAFIRENVPLAGLTTFGIGGSARWLAEPATRAELARSLEVGRQLGAQILILGGGSNLLVSDAGVDALVLKLAGNDEFGLMNPQAEASLIWRVGAAVPLPALVAAVAGQGISGLEMLAGIPGSVGGAVAMNCGGRDGSIGAFVMEAEVHSPQGEARILNRDELYFRYRSSNLAGALAVNFVMQFTNREETSAVLEKMRVHRESKIAGQPVTFPSAGCIFKNPDGDSAGALLDRAGCKGMREGGAEVSSLHANFIVNRGGATSSEVAVLARRMREAVLGKFGVTLEPEIVLWGTEPAFIPLRGGE